MSRLATPLVLVITVVSLFCALAAPAFASTPGDFTVEIADVGKGRELAALLQEKGFKTVLPDKNMWVVDPQSNCAVWIGKNVPLDMLRAVLPEAVRLNPYLKFFHVVGDRGEMPPQAVDNTVHIGGNIEAAMAKKLNVIDPQEMLSALEKAKDLAALHQYLHEKNIPVKDLQEKSSH